MDTLKPHDPSHFGPYQLDARLGTGGMGEVYLATSPGGRKVAVKVIRPEHAADPRFRARFAREIEAARKVGGFHTAQVVDADPDAPSPWMATAYIPGPSLRQVVIQQGPLAQVAVRELGAALAEGLIAIHACGLIHRDLKPGNVILSMDGPRIIDFGIARVIDATALTAAGAIVGTYAFMSPEQVRAEATGPASDVFSLACVLTYAATGHGPFDAPTVPAIVHRITSRPPVLRNLTGDLLEVIAASLAKNPAERPTLPEVLVRLSVVQRRISRRRLLAFGGLTTAAAALTTSALLVRQSKTTSTHNRVPATPIGTPTATTLPAGSVRMYSVTYSPDGKTLLGAGYGQICRWNLTTGRSRNTDHETELWEGAVLSHDGNFLATSDSPSGKVKLWDMTTGRTLATLSQDSATWRAENGIQHMAFSPDAKTLVIDSRPTSTIQFWNVTTRRIVSTLPGNTDGLWFSPDGQTLFAADFEKVKRWDVATGAPRSTIEISGNLVTAFAFSPGDDDLAIALLIKHTIEFRDTTGDKILHTLTGHIDRVLALAFSPDGQVLAAGDNSGAIRLWHVPTGRSIAALDGDTEAVTTLAFSPDGQSFASGGQSGTTKVWSFS